MASKKGETPRAGRGRAVLTEGLRAEILERLAAGETLRAICRDEHMPTEGAVRQLCDRDEAFAARYAKAREDGYLQMADELLEIADDGSNDWLEREIEEGRVEVVFNNEHYQRSRLRVDTRKWLLSKALPKIYGDRISMEHTGKNGGPIQHGTEYADLPREDLERMREERRARLNGAATRH